MGKYHELKYPGETDNYRSQRNELLSKEMELREKIEEVAFLRRSLGSSAPLKEDYILETMTGIIRDM